MTEPVTEEVLIEPSGVAELNSPIDLNPNITFEPPLPIVETPSITLVESQDSRGIDPFEGTPVSHPQQYRPIPKTGSGPAGNYYAELHWPNFQQWPMVRFQTPMDGSCFFHAISNSFFAPYHTEMLKGKHVSRDRMVAMLRRELSEKLAKKISDDPEAPTHYDILNGGNTRAFAEAVPEFSLANMQHELASRNPIGFGYLEFIGNALNKDIYILEAEKRDIYVSHELSLTIKGNRKSIVLYYIPGHYELVGLQRPDGGFDTHFSPEHSFIRFLNGRVQEIIKKQS